MRKPDETDKMHGCYISDYKKGKVVSMKKTFKKGIKMIGYAVLTAAIALTSVQLPGSALSDSDSLTLPKSFCGLARAAEIITSDGDTSVQALSKNNNLKTAAKYTISDLCFNAVYYADANEDLKKAYGYDEQKLRKHWETYGIKEGRTASPVLDLTYYRNNNADIKNAFGNDYAAIYNHFLQSGYSEFRPSSKYYNGDYYKKNNSDLKKYDSESLLYHYLRYGIWEGRSANTEKYTPIKQTSVQNASPDEIAKLCFNAVYYADNNEDLKKAYGYDEQKLREHWVTYGIKEGRTASPVLDLAYYRNNNADIKNAFGNDYTAIYNHFLKNGYSEFRPSSKYYNGSYYRYYNSDLAQYDSAFLLRHYIENGIWEKRSANTELYTPYTPSSVQNAANSAEIEKLCFNYKYYADTYEDLKKAYGYDEQKLKEHWLTNGIKEGRTASPVLDLTYYRNNNADIKEAFGNDYTAIYNHFLQSGYSEFRPSSKYYNGSYYRNSYSDLAQYDSKFLLDHYLRCGIQEGRYANVTKYDGPVFEYNPVPAQPSVESSSFQWPVTNYYVCGNKWSQYYSAKGKDHLGMDIKSSSGDTNIYSAGEGTVMQTGWNSANGNTITIKHTISGKTVYSFYAHLKSVSVSTGSKVSKGQKIGVIGNTGSSSTGTHLHFAFTTQCGSGTWGYGTSFSDNANSASYQGYTFYNPTYVINNGKLP